MSEWTRRGWVAVAWCGVLTLAACQPTEAPDVCAGVTCGHGRCVVDQGAAACLCDEDYRAEGLACVPRAVDPCLADPCAGLTTSECVADGGVASCQCPADRVLIDGVCVPRTPCTPNPCTTAPRRTVCQVVGGAAVCSCEPGYAPNGTGCAPTPTWSCAAQHSGPDEDNAEPNECPPQAWQLVAGAPDEVFNLKPAGDHDWFALPVVNAHIYRVIAAVTSGAPTLILEVFDHAGVVVLASDTSGTRSAEVRVRATGAAEPVNVNETPGFRI